MAVIDRRGLTPTPRANDGIVMPKDVLTTKTVSALPFSGWPVGPRRRRSDRPSDIDGMSRVGAIPEALDEEVSSRVASSATR